MIYYLLFTPTLSAVGSVTMSDMKKPAVITFSILAVVIVTGIVFYLIPAPFKPSLWSDLMHHATQAQLDKSSDPVYLPRTNQTASAGGITYHSRFTMYSTWKDAYYIQAINQGYYYQLSVRSIIEQDSTGPEATIIHFLRDVRDGKVCDIKNLEITECSFGDRQYNGDRKFKIYSKDGYIFVTEITQVVYGTTRDSLRLLSPEEIQQIELMLKDTSPTPLAEARKSRFEYDI